MNVKRYFAKTVREALRELKAELGADAIVLSNRAVEGGVEILALPAEAVSAAPAKAVATPRSIVTPERQAIARGAAFEAVDDGDEGDFRVSLSARAAGVASSRPSPRADLPHPPRPVAKPFLAPRPSTVSAAPTDRSDADADALFPFDAWGAAGAYAAQGAPAATGEPPVAVNRPREVAQNVRDEAAAAVEQRIQSLQDANAGLMAELAGIRGMIERQLAGFAWGDARRNAPGRAQVVGELLEAGFSATLARTLGESVSDQVGLDEARKIVRNALGRDLRARSSDADLIDQGGVYALVGPTGVGKTTTTAKIAARCVLRHGAEKVALITTDGYRIGAQEQLRIYGRILGVPVFPVRDASDLRQTLAELGNRHIVLIDTVGMSQRDRMVAHQAAMLTGAGNVQRLLLLNATCRGDTLDDVIRAYNGPDLAGCVFTKVDEAASLAPVIGAAIAHALDVFYVANGQRVPEDLHLPNRAYLLHRALRGRDEESPWSLRDDEAALMLAAGAAGR